MNRQENKKINVVEVFRTNVAYKRHANILLSVLSELFPLHKINFDLDDCDKILRVEGEVISPQKIIECVHARGYQCHVLD